MEFAQLWPEPATVEVQELLTGLELGLQAPPDRPLVVANFVASLDGRATVKGRSGLLGDAGDKALFHALRASVDAVLAGTGTLQAERYGRMIGERAVRERRSERGLAPEPLACTLTRGGRLPLGIPLFAEPEAEIVVYSGAEIDLGAVAAQVRVVKLDPSEPGFSSALADLRERGVRSVLCEGGPRVFAALLREGVVDQLFLTLAGKLTGGGGGPTITTGPELPEPAEMALAGLLEREGTLYLRYVRRS